MSERILVAYATRYGSTEEVAERVAATLRECGLEVALEPARNVQSLEGYTAVILGAPLYIGHWLKDAKRLLAEHRDALTKRPLALFTLGPTEDREEDWQGAREQLDKELASHDWLSPVSSELFGGVFDPKKLRFPMSLLVKMPASPLSGKGAMDIRDWAAIGAWARGLPEKLLPGPAQ